MDSMSRQKTLIDGRMMKCPRCKKQHDILQYLRMEVIEEFAAETTPCYKCPSCKWIFAPAGEMPQDFMIRFNELISEMRERMADLESHDRQ